MPCLPALAITYRNKCNCRATNQEQEASSRKTLCNHEGLEALTRRAEGVSILVVPSDRVTASNPDDRDSLFDPALDKTFRHPTDYELPDDVAHM